MNDINDNWEKETDETADDSKSLEDWVESYIKSITDPDNVEKMVVEYIVGVSNVSKKEAREIASDMNIERIIRETLDDER